MTAAEKIAVMKTLDSEPGMYSLDITQLKSDWSQHSLARRFGEDIVSISNTLGSDESKPVRLDEFLSYCKTTPPSGNLYYLHWWFGQTRPELYDDMILPWYLRSWLDNLPAHINPKLRWFLAGPEGSGTNWHSDSWGTSAWCILLQGTKTWEFSTGQTIVQVPGNLVYVPAGVKHRVQNELPSYALTGNIVHKWNILSVREAIGSSKPWIRILDQLERENDEHIS